LLRLVTDAARADGRTDLVDAAPVGHVAGSAFAARVGATPGLVERQNRLSVAELDPTMLERWVDRARERATDYSLVAFDGPCPDELVDGFARLMQVMDTAPRTDIWHDSVVTPEMAREGGAAFQRLGGTSWVVCAREDATGRLVGYSFLGFVVHRPWLGIQGDTGIEPAHRNRGLGRWLKATNALRLLDERPEVEIVETWNADVNAPMLSINTAMGFRQAAAWQEWELRIS
jgi:GNAT superfamily N-acetyltransferase